MNHNIPTTTMSPAVETEDTETSHEVVDTVTNSLGDVAVAGIVENPVRKHKEMVGDAYFQVSPGAFMEMVDRGEIDVNDTDIEDRTPVMMMTSHGQTKVVEELIARNADVNRIMMYQDRLPMSALDAARQTNRKDIEELLLSHGAKSGRELYAEQLAAEQTSSVS